jgi:hypothetical protein
MSAHEEEQGPIELPGSVQHQHAATASVDLDARSQAENVEHHRGDTYKGKPDNIPAESVMHFTTELPFDVAVAGSTQS